MPADACAPSPFSARATAADFVVWPRARPPWPRQTSPRLRALPERFSERRFGVQPARAGAETPNVDESRRIQAPPAGAGRSRPSDARPRRAIDAAFEHLDTGVVVVDVDGVVVSINREAERLLGIVTPHAPEQRLADLVDDAPLREALADACRRAADAWPARTEVVAGGRTIRVASAPLERDDAAPWILLRVDDVTAHRRADERAEALLSIVSHELRTPLTVIRGYLDAFDRELFGSLSPECRDAVGRMLEQCRELDERIRDLIRFRDLTRAGAPEPAGPVDLAERVRHAVEAMRPAVERAGQSIEARVPTQAPHIRADAGVLDAILRHLVDNAVKFAGPGATIAVEVAPHPNGTPPAGREVVAPSTAARAGGVRLSVCDDGAGIAPERIDDALRPFSQCEPHLTRHAAGMGLGLPTVVHAVERFGGGLWMDTDVGRGVSVHIVMPRCDDAAHGDRGDDIIEEDTDA